MMPRPVLGLALVLALATVVACASTGSRSTVSTAAPTIDLATRPTAVRYSLDALRATDGTTYQGTLEVRGDRALLVIDEAARLGRTTREYGGTIERGDVTYLALSEGEVPAGELECTDDGRGLTCAPKRDRIFGGRLAQLRFERLTLDVQSF